MKQLFKAMFLTCLLPLSLLAQQSTIRGTVTDTAANTKLFNASISVLNLKDSTLVSFTRASADGHFGIELAKQGKYILLVTYPKYADYVEKFSLDSTKKTVDFENINLLLKSKLLADVIVKGQVAAIKIKGDTTEYNAGSFKIQPNAKVEDLLKQLPGIQVDKDGKITAQGETVTKVLVDGEEFFGDDPTLVTKNLRGDMIDKVQLYDKKSDQATFTGIDDGIKNKTINLKLKEDKKQGYFGKVNAGSDNNYYAGQGMFNAFKAKRKLSAYVTLSNTSKTGLDWEDANKYGGGGNTEVSDDGGVYFYSSRDDLRYNGQGLPAAKTGGAHYDSKWNKDKESINVNYKVGELGVDGVRNNLSQNVLPTEVFNTNSAQTFSNYTFRQKMDATYTLKIDTTSNLKIVLDGSLSHTRSKNFHDRLSTQGDTIKQNHNTISNNTNGDNSSLYANVFYNKKLKKKGRTFSINLTQTVNDGKDEGLLNTYTEFFDRQGVFARDTVVDQYKTTISSSSAFGSNFTYTEPITKTWSLVLNYGFNLNKSTSDRKSLNKALATGEYTLVDELFSNNFEFNQTSNQGGAVFNYKNKKALVNIGTKINAVDLEQIDLTANRVYSRDFVNINPQASYQYRFTQYKSLRFSYDGNTQQPRINDIQPVRVNNDPNNIYLGNPDLKAAYRSNFSANYNTYKILTQQYVYAYGNYSFTINPVVNSTFTDSLRKSTHQSFNLSDKVAANYNLRANFSKKVKALGFSVGVNGGLNGSRSYNYINNVLNSLEYNSYSMGLQINNYVEKKYQFYFNLSPGYNTYKSTIKTSQDNSGGKLDSYGDFTIYLPGKVEVGANYQYNLTKKTSTFNQDVDYFILNSFVSKKFMKDESLKLSLSGNDLLNQNVGFSRNTSGTTISQNSYTTIKRYFMVSVIWDFNKMGGGLKPKN